jgi:hypothetical protein
MNWNEITTEVIKQLKSEERRLATNRRFTVLEALGKLIREEYKRNPNILLQIGMQSLINEILVKKKLNQAEIEALNHIYSVLKGEPIPIKKWK